MTTRTGSLLAVVASVMIATAATAREKPRCGEVRGQVQPQLDAACPCDTAASHAAHVKCVTDKLRALTACHKGADGKQVCDGVVPRACVGILRRTALRSGCGDPKSVTCCVPKQHDCSNDPTPADGKKEGTCAGDKRPCDTLQDCRIPACRQARDADRCKAIGGTLGTGKDCSTACAQ